MIRLIASDIDGTLLLNGATEIPREIFGHIRRLEQKGILFCPASGRRYSSLRDLFAPVADTVPFLCENGSVIYGPGSPGPILSKTVMDRRLAEEVCRDVMAQPGVEVVISCINTCYICPKSPRLRDEIRWFLGGGITVTSSPEAVPEDILKVSAYCPKDLMKVKAALFPKWEPHFRCAISGEVWLDFTMSDKGSGVARLCEVLDIGLEDVMAFGDNYNDIPMLERVGHPYLMAGAVPELRERFSSQCRTVGEILASL